MSKIKCSFAELHNPLFLGGTNLQPKLDTNNRKGLVLMYDRVEKELIVQWNGAVAIIPSSNVASMNPIEIPEDIAKDLQPIPESKDSKQIAKAKSKQEAKATVAKFSAQVSDPTRDVVFSQGPGKVRD